MDKLKIEYTSVKELVPYANNARTHSDDQVVEIMNSILRFGFTNPVLIDEHGGIIAGHGRTLAASRLNMKTVPTITLAHLTDDEKRAYVIADNKLAENAGWDLEKLSAELQHLSANDFDLGLLGFDDLELKRLINLPEDPQEEEPPQSGHGESTDDDAPDLREEVRAQLIEKWKVEPGQMWQLGDHRIICGDSRFPETYQRLMGTEKAQMTFTDPPYGVDYHDRQGDHIQNDELTRDDLSVFLQDCLRCMVKFTKDTGAFYIWHASTTRKDFEHAMTIVGLVEKQYIVWVKDTFVLGWSDYRWQTEPCFYAQKDGQTAEFYGERNNSNVWRVGKINSDNQAIQIATGIVITDGAGETIYVQSKPPKNKKYRHVRIGGRFGNEISLSTGEVSDCWQVSRDPIGEYLHPNQKPIELALKGIENSSKPGDIVLDPFGGAGFTLLGCEICGRKARTVEKDPQFVAVIIERWSQSTGKIPILL